jgi:hypothetical protein
MNALRLGACALLVTALLAGCTSPSSSSSNGIDPSVDVKSTATTGVIKGVVVDAAIKPLAKAVVTVKANGKTFTNATNAQGGFGFANLEPGTYFVSASKAGYVTGQTSVEVKANDDNPLATRITLEADRSFVKPFYVEYHFKGFIECSTTTAVPGVVGLGFAACSTIGIVAPGALPDDFSVRYPLDTIPDYAQSELIWSSTQQLGSALTLEWSRDCGSKNGGFLCDYGAEGTSPVLVKGDKGQVANATLQEGDGTHVLYIRVFNTGVPEAMGAVGLTFEQGFDVYTHLFYGYKPGEWRFSSGAPVPKPPVA